MSKLYAIAVSATLVLVGGCSLWRGDNGSRPIVAPSEISNEVQDEIYPPVPTYVPWWVDEEDF